MKRRFIWIFLTLMLVIVLSVISCAKQTSTQTSTAPSPSVTAPKPTTTSTPSQTTAAPGPGTTTAPGPTTSAPPTTSVTKANWWDKFGTPQYGGTITVRNARIGGGSLDPTAGMAGAGGMATNCWLQGLAFFDWTLDRNIWSYPCGFTPIEYLKGLLIESWEQTSPDTIALKVRKEARWQNRAPVNGRNFKASDIKFNIERALQSPMMASGFSAVKGVTVIDDLTAQVNLKQPGVLGLYQVLGSMMGYIPPEWVDKADPTDPKMAVGTGPFMLVELVEGTSMRMVKNPDYWQNDERHPQNKLPYIDELVQLAIPDPATALAAMRTGKVDMWTDHMGAMTIEQGESLAKTNPEIVIFANPRPAAILELRVDKPPFTDIRVRKALNMAIDRDAIIKVYYKGSKYAKPVGLVSSVLTGFAVPYEDWPEDLKKEYSYNVAEARKLLTEAGYPNGFKTNCVAPADQDYKIAEVLKSYFKEIGVDMEIRVMERAAYSAFLSAGMHDQMAFSDGMGGLLWTPANTLFRRVSRFAPQNNPCFTNDPVYDKMYDDWNSATTDSEFKRLSREMDLYALRQHWQVTVCNSHTPVACQPWIKGFSGEINVDPSWAGATRARIWIDQNVKKSMGK